PTAQHDPKNTENGAGDRGADDPEHDIHQEAHIALHELLGQPAGDSADDNGRDPAHFRIVHGASPQNEALLRAGPARLATAPPPNWIRSRRAVNSPRPRRLFELRSGLSHDLVA